MASKSTILFAFVCSCTASILYADTDVFVPSKRELPVVYEVDLLVLGGTTGGIAAALGATEEGRSALVVSPFPYLGENLTATLRLDPDEKESLTDPLAKAVFQDPMPMREQWSPYHPYLDHPARLKFRYEIEGPVGTRSSAAVQTRLTDGKGMRSPTEQIQLDDDAVIFVDLEKTQTVRDIALLAFTRVGQTGFDIREVKVSSSDDRRNWKVLGTATRRTNAAPIEFEQQRDRLTPFVLQLDAPVETRYLKVEVFKPQEMSRMLLSELVILPENLAMPSEESMSVAKLPRPMHVKRELDRALIAAEVPFLYNTYLNAWVRDDRGVLRGAVLSNKAGRQAVLAKQMIYAPSSFHWNALKPGAMQQVEFTVIGGEPVEVVCGQDDSDPLRSARCLPGDKPFYGPANSGPPREADAGQPDIETIAYPLLTYRFEVLVPQSLATPAERDTFLAGLEARIRLATYHPDQAFTADQLYFLPSSSESIDETEPNLVRIHPDLPMAQGRKIGKELSNTHQPLRQGDLRVAPLEALWMEQAFDAGIMPGDLKEKIGGIRSGSTSEQTVLDAGSPLPVLGCFDVIVVGGGTSGAAAGIGAARNNAATLVLEHMHALGGIGTVGAITVYYYGNRVGFTKETVEGKHIWKVEERAYWWLEKLHEAGGESRLGTLAVGAVMKDNRVVGVAVATPQGPGIFLGGVVIDSTGNGDIAALTGTPMYTVSGSELALQGAGLPPRNLGAGVTNTDFMYVDENDVLDAVHVFAYAKEKYPAAFDQGKLLDTRERQRIMGEFTVSLLDQINERTHPDTIVQAYSNFDSHGFTTTPYLEIAHPEKAGIWADVPYRASLPVGIEGLLVSGLATSCHRDALPVIRMQPDLQNQGYALGYIAAEVMNNRHNDMESVDLRAVDIRSIQKHLVAIGNLKPAVATDEDNYEPRRKELPEAVRMLADNFKGANIVLWYPEEARPLVHRAFLDAEDLASKQIYAKVAAALGDPVGVDVLIEQVESFKEWDVGWNFRSAGQFGAATSELDQLIMMLGRTRSSQAVPAILKKMKPLTQTDDFSHQRACFLALEWISDPSAAPALAEILRKPGMMGHSHETYEEAKHWNTTLPGGTVSIHTRRNSLLEISAARALYRCGDHEGLGESVLRRYANDRRGHFARHAMEVLNSK